MRTISCAPFLHTEYTYLHIYSQRNCGQKLYVEQRLELKELQNFWQECGRGHKSVFWINSQPEKRYSTQTANNNNHA